MNQHTNLSMYAARNWQIIEKQDRLYWIREYRQHGPEATMQASYVLWQHMRHIRPEWPTARDRQEDLQQHFLLKQILQQAAEHLVAG